MTPPEPEPPAVPARPRASRVYVIGVKNFVTQEHVPMYFWIIDGREAVFSIPDIGGLAIETSFITSDVNLTKQSSSGFSSSTSEPCPQ